MGEQKPRELFPGEMDGRTLRERFGFYDFFATPDGEECLAKTYYYTKYATITGSLFSVYEMVLQSQPKTVYSTIARFGRFTLPFAGMGFVFGSSLCLVAQARKKDDIFNHIIAGALAGSVWGFKYNRVYPGHVGAVIVGAYAGYHKYFRLNNIEIAVSPEVKNIRYDPMFDWHVKFYDDPGRPDRAV